ncbi:MAG: nucleotidyl transferase AbiEii/AbiGii toxin family protein [Aeromicrobium sp.]|uniref:nucleotidyl transferase AbiEii/AbiGii toxin family protein n=1 Tax=Aeromicrobium sp. TaxID=1871063 RepID=UPI0039E3F424
MSPRPARDSPSGRAYNDLRNLARRQGRDPAEFFTLYALEGFLARLADSEHADGFVLKGGVLMAAFASRRPTRDIDLAAIALSNDVAEAEQRVRDIIGRPRDDGLDFDLSSVVGEPIRDEADYSGVRVTFVAGLSTARVQIHVDVNFGDPIWPAPVETELPLLLGGTLRLQGYPDHMVLAEKIVTAVERASQNTRWRDFVDIASMASTREIEYDLLRDAVKVVAECRGVAVRPLGPLVTPMGESAQRKWMAWRRKQRLESSTSAELSALLDACVAFADPVLRGESPGSRWSPEARRWCA